VLELVVAEILVLCASVPFSFFFFLFCWVEIFLLLYVDLLINFPSSMV